MAGIVESIVVPYFVEKGLDAVYNNLTEFAKTVSSIESDQKEPHLSNLPSVCLLGFGRCGSNISVGVSELVYRAHQDFKSNQPEESPDTSDERGLQSWYRSKFPLLSGKRDDGSSPLFLVEPIVIVGDLDKDINKRLHASTFLKNINENYQKLVILDLEEIHRGGAGNVPVLGQYLANVILSKDPKDFSNERWPREHSYIIDSAGLPENPSRLFFYIFSAGGGTGSGMAGEFALAQQMAFYNRIHQIDDMESATKKIGSENSVFEPIFSAGIAVLPHGTYDETAAFQAVHANAGRLLVSYCAQEYRQKSVTTDVHKSIPLRPFNCLIIISNDIMQFEEDSENTKPLDITEMERKANRYVSQQIFNILTAQASTSDYDTGFIDNSDIDIGDTIRLDPNDLQMSLSGPIAVAYAEEHVETNRAKPLTLDIKAMLRRAVGIPCLNEKTEAIEGISIIPSDISDYKDLLSGLEHDEGWKGLGSKVNLFQRSPAIVVIVSVPIEVRLEYDALNDLKRIVGMLFPNTKLVRYSVIVGASSNVSLTILISKSVVSCDEPFQLLVGYIKRCFGKPEQQDSTNIETAIMDYLSSPEPSDELFDMLFEKENPQEIIQENWALVQQQYEQKAKHLLGRNNGDDLVSISELSRTQDDVRDCLNYLREALRWKRPKVSRPSISNLDIDGNVEDSSD